MASLGIDYFKGMKADNEPAISLPVHFESVKN